jgi:hypothetical protein
MEEGRDTMKITRSNSQPSGKGPAEQGMTHIAIAEALDGKTVDWMEKVSDEQYGK